MYFSCMSYILMNFWLFYVFNVLGGRVSCLEAAKGRISSITNKMNTYGKKEDMLLSTLKMSGLV